MGTVLAEETARRLAPAFRPQLVQFAGEGGGASAFGLAFTPIGGQPYLRTKPFPGRV